MACGRVSEDNASSCRAACFTDTCKPSAPPMMNATSDPARIQSCICPASCLVVSCAPRSSRAMRRQFCGRTASMRCASVSMICATVLPVVRGSGLISSSSILASRGMRLAYSLKPVVIQSGILCPTETMMSFILSAVGVRRAVPLRGFCQLGPRRLRLAPQLFQVVVIADGRLHDVNQHFIQINQYPFPAVLPLAPQHFFAPLLALDHHIVCKRLGLAFGRGAGDDHAIEQRAEFAGVDHSDVGCFDIFKGGDDGLGFFFGSQHGVYR